MADKTISSLPAATTVDDSSLWVAENQGQAQKVTGAQIKGFARESVQQYVSQAQQAAQEAQEAVTQIGTAVDDTEANAQAAQAAQTSAESARDEAIEASQGVSEYVTQAQQAASQATQSASDAQISASTAETYSDSAEIAKTAAETAKSIAETARDNAEAASAAAAGYSSTAQTSASQASQSAQTAQSAQSAAEIAKTGAEDARHAIENMMVEAITLATGQPATVSKSLVDQVVKLTFGLPTGAKGNPGDKGDTGTGIQSIELTSGTHAPGTTDTYTITLSDDSTFQFTVYNGANGTGAGDFMADGSVPMTGNLDINGNRVTEVGPPTADTDAANKGYVDEAVSNMEITTDTTPTQGSTNPVQSGGVYTALSKKQDNITGQQGQVVGFDAEGKPVAQAAPDTGVTSFNGRKGAVSPQARDYTADMVGARADTWTPSAEDVGAVPTTRTVNGHALSANVTLDADDVGARANNWTPTASEVGAVPTSRTVNGKPLSSNISLTADDVGAANPPTLRTVTLTASGWSSNTQTVTVQGVKTSGQSVRISPATKTDADNWVAAGVWCSEPTTANQLVFTCDTAPTENININVELQEVQS